MKWKNRLTNYNFWISITSAALLILQAFKFQFDIAYINEIATAVLGLLVVIGIISDPTKVVVSSSEQKPAEKTVKTEKEALVLPAEVETETSVNNVEDDFKTVISKISKDLEERLNEISKLQSELLNEKKTAKLETEMKNNLIETNLQTEVKIPTCLNIVN